ncbi:MAG TPA: A/G-specific adenine glycosylase, partial [Rectinemataceae bacterium]
YTARAVLAFAFDLPTIFLETNIRTALIKHYFPDSATVSDKELEPIAHAVLDPSSPRRWYSALMDYGAWIKRIEGNHGARAAAYAPQAPFVGSMRRLRGALLKKLLADGSLEVEATAGSFAPYTYAECKKAAAALAAEGFAEYVDGVLSIKS